ncbi:hypothetical protein [uncultured Draconibacterium sp.]|uniref:hypothetical protein n=1 Tax=uncultured Draconibacterium sp. TaxID=1573823 RepID=UPI0025FF1667|nr:hypothetical protein [uncultured Draconibacterium sp.]
MNNRLLGVGGKKIFSGWNEDSSLIDGLPYLGTYKKPHPTVFYLGAELYMIAGRNLGTFDGYKWDGSAWQSHSGIVSGLPDLGNNSKPDVFELNGNTYLISGEGSAQINGFRWSETNWVTDSSIISGISVTAGYLDVTCFEMDSRRFLLLGSSDIGFQGYEWDGSVWVSYSTIVNGLLGDYDISYRIASCVFFANNNAYMITIHDNDHLSGFVWDEQRSKWIADNLPITGISLMEWDSIPEVFTVDGNLKLMIGYDGDYTLSISYIGYNDEYTA